MLKGVKVHIDRMELLFFALYAFAMGIVLMGAFFVVGLIRGLPVGLTGDFLFAMAAVGIGLPVASVVWVLARDLVGAIMKARAVNAADASHRAVAQRGSTRLR